MVARSAAFLEFVRSQPCVGCMAPPRNDAHHWGARGVGIKTEDYRTVPLCRMCHQTFHQQGRVGPFDRDRTRFEFLRAQVDLLVRWNIEQDGA